MRLIDADKLKDYMQEIVKAQKGRDIDLVPVSEIPVLIDRQPTAYDVDKVVEQIKGNSRKMATAKCPHKYYRAIGTRKCEQIIRAGGKEQK